MDDEMRMTSGNETAPRIPMIIGLDPFSNISPIGRLVSAIYLRESCRNNI